MCKLQKAWLVDWRRRAVGEMRIGLSARIDARSTVGGRTRARTSLTRLLACRGSGMSIPLSHRSCMCSPATRACALLSGHGLRFSVWPSARRGVRVENRHCLDLKSMNYDESMRYTLYTLALQREDPRAVPDPARPACRLWWPVPGFFWGDGKKPRQKMRKIPHSGLWESLFVG